MRAYVARLIALSVFAAVADRLPGDGKLRASVRIVSGLLALGVVIEAAAAVKAMLGN